MTVIFMRVTVFLLPQVWELCWPAVRARVRGVHSVSDATPSLQVQGAGVRGCSGGKGSGHQEEHFERVGVTCGYCVTWNTTPHLYSVHYSQQFVGTIVSFTYLLFSFCQHLPAPFDEFDNLAYSNGTRHDMHYSYLHVFFTLSGDVIWMCCASSLKPLMI